MRKNLLLAKPLLHKGNIMEAHMGFSLPAAVVAVGRRGPKITTKQYKTSLRKAPGQKNVKFTETERGCVLAWRTLTCKATLLGNHMG